MNTKSRGPGPGCYMLPPTIGFKEHDVRKQRRPQYSFGIQIYEKNRAFGPGPGAYGLGKQTRHGNDGTPRFTMRPQIYEIEKSKSPGPAAHNVHTSPFFKGVKAPAYTFRPRVYAEWFRTVSPSPNTYMVTVGGIKNKAPIYSMGISLNVKPLVKSPGPATYGRTDLNVKLTKSPVYSMKARNIYLFKDFSPGPCTYNIAYHRPGRKQPVYSFGTRHSDYAPPFIVPCDNP